MAVLTLECGGIHVFLSSEHAHERSLILNNAAHHISYEPTTIKMQNSNRCVSGVYHQPLVYTTSGYTLLGTDYGDWHDSDTLSTLCRGRWGFVLYFAIGTALRARSLRLRRKASLFLRALNLYKERSRLNYFLVLQMSLFGAGRRSVLKDVISKWVLCNFSKVGSRSGENWI
jgi:hypothetical protein